jgi:hypothetical protein
LQLLAQGSEAKKMAEPNYQSQQVFLRSHQVRYDAVKSCLQKLAEAFGNATDDDILARGAELHAAVESLRDNLSPQDRPPWMESMLNLLNMVRSNPGNPSRLAWLVQVLTNSYLPATNHEWGFQAVDDGAFDFDGLYEQHRTQSKLPQLFDKLIGLLEKLIASDDLDSRKVEHTLKILIATLKKNRNGSFVGMVFSWNFAITYLRKLCWELPKEIPGLRAFSTALRDTMQEITAEIDSEMSNVHEKMANDVQEKLGVHLSALQYTPLPALTNESDIIDVEATPIPGASPKDSEVTK